MNLVECLNHFVVASLTASIESHFNFFSSIGNEAGIDAEIFKKNALQSLNHFQKAATRMISLRPRFESVPEQNGKTGIQLRLTT